MIRKTTRGICVWALSGMLVISVAAGCGNAGSSSSTTSTPPPTGNNVAAITVNGGPATGDGVPYPNGAFTSVTICVPGSTTNCQTIDGILVDTGSFGLRIQSSALTLSLPQQVDANNNPMVECGEFGSGFTWGPVQTTDLTISGETASSLPIQVVGSPNYPDTDANGAATCSNGEAGTVYDLNSVESMGANGILGVGLLAQDCGSACTLSGPSNPDLYYSCPTAATCTATTEALTSQVVNPVALFATDNNGVIVELPAVAAATATTSVNGYLIFGIGTETNNGLGTATVYGVDPNTGNFTTVYNNVSYDDASFIDLGSEVIFFLDPTTTGMLTCQNISSLYCPTSNTTFSVTNEGTNGNSGTISFVVGNGESLTSNSSYNAINGLAGPLSGTFDWGLPFFFGRNVYTAIDCQNPPNNCQTTPAGTGPYWAY